MASQILKIVKWNDILDIIIVTLIIYQILLWFKGTRAIQLLKGLFFLLLLFLISFYFSLSTIHWLLSKFATVVLLLIIILFQPELRQALERIGRGRFFAPSSFQEKYKGMTIFKHIIKSVDYLSKNKYGALIVLEKTTSLDSYGESGIQIDSFVSNELLTSLFFPHAPTHDGAVIIQGNRILAAACLLPLSESSLIDKRLGTRHRAAIGLTEKTDAIVIAVSEETGIISLSENGNLTRYLSREALESRLLSIYETSKKSDKYNILNIFSAGKQETQKD